MSTFSTATVHIDANQFPTDTDLKELKVLLPAEKKPLPFGQQIWGTFFLNECARIATLKLSAQQWQVLMLMLSQMSYGQRVEVSQTSIASDLNIPKSRVCEAIRALVEAGILIEDAKIGTSRIYRFNANFVFRGKTKFVHKQQQADAAEVNSMHAKRARDKFIADTLKAITDGRPADEVFEEIDRAYEDDADSIAYGWELIREIADKAGVPSPF